MAKTSNALGLNAVSGAVLLLLLLQSLVVTEGGECPSRVVYSPEMTSGFPRPSRQLRDSSESVVEGVPLSWGWPSEYQQTCCSSGRIVEWTVTPTEEFQYVARVSALCSSGERISSPLYGSNNTGAATNDKYCPNGTAAGQTLFQPDNEGVFPYVSVSFMTSFMGVGRPLKADYVSIFDQAISCPAGTRAMGIGARSGCYALLELQVLCARTTDTQNNAGGSLELQPRCPSTSYARSGAGFTAAVSSRQTDAVSDDHITDCCPSGEGIANWTIARSFFDSGRYIGLIQGACTDNTVLSAIYYGYNGRGNIYCNQQRMRPAEYFRTPKSQDYHYSILRHVTRSVNVSVLDSFMTLSDEGVRERRALVCPDGQAAVGYSAASSCYSLQGMSVLCGNLSDSAKAVLDMYGSNEADPPENREAGVCPGGLSMEPDGRYYRSTPDNKPIGKISAWHIDPETAGPSSLNPNETIFASAASTLTSICCPSGQSITAFNVWPSDNINLLVGKVSAVCANLDGSRPTNTSAIAYGFNGTSLNGTALFCRNSTKNMKTMPLLEGKRWNYRAAEGFESLLEWPNRTLSNSYGALSSITYSTCPSRQQPIAFSARRSCWGLADFRVICGIVNKKTQDPANTSAISPTPANTSAVSPAPANTSVVSTTPANTATTGLTAGGKAGIAVGIIAAAALVALLAAFVFYRLRQSQKTHTCIESRQLFNLNGPAGFYTGVTLASKESLPSQDSRGMGRLLSRSTGLMTIENIDRSDDNTPISFDGIPPEWEIKANQLKLHCVDGKPIELGRGGCGVVLYGTVHKEDAAIKMIKGRSKENALLKEIAILERAKTKYVVRFLGYSVCPDGILLAMEYMQGGTLWQELRDSDEYQWYKRGSQAFKDICKGLYMLHSNRIAHLDMKTPNILIADDGTCKISDLGLGKLFQTDANTATAETIGSFAWMGPEQMVGRCGFSSDIWALSTILWEICTLRSPTREASPSDILIPDEAPQEVADLMAACRQEDPHTRPLIDTICDILDSWSGAAPELSGQVSLSFELQSPRPF